EAVSIVGHGRDRHDEPAGSEARARGGDLLCDARARDGLRLLASRSRFGDGRSHNREPDAERRHGAEDDRGRGGADARAAGVRVQGRARARHHHAAAALAGTDEEGARAHPAEVHAMKIVVTGSIAYDYLMSFPGKFTEHFLADHIERVSLSFLVDTMDKRRGGCAPNIAYTLALLGERPLLMATSG